MVYYSLRRNRKWELRGSMEDENGRKEDRGLNSCSLPFLPPNPQSSLFSIFYFSSPVDPAPLPLPSNFALSKQAMIDNNIVIKLY